jgi:thiamine transport system ATP-binding protein
MLTLDGLVIEQEGFRLAADWSVAAGERVAIIGTSGGGKSTLLLALSGFVAPCRGRILWQGQDLGPLPPGERPISILFQDQNLFPHLTLAQNLGLGLSPRLSLTPDQHRAVADSLRRFGLVGLGDRKPAQVSGGQASRAALARALLRARPILLLDEPFSALGPGLKDEMLDLVAQGAADTGATVLMVTHDPRDARRLASLTVLVDDGQALPPQPTGALFADPPESLRSYLGHP